MLNHDQYSHWMDREERNTEFDWTDGLEKYPIHCRNEGKLIPRDIKVQNTVYSI